MENKSRRDAAGSRGQNTRQQILAATEKIIQERGLARVTTKEIAREAGFSEGTLYKHFTDKEDLFLSVIHKNLPSFARVLEEHPAGTETVRANLEKIALAALSYYDKLIPLSASFLADTELLASYRRTLETTGSGPQRFYERMADYIAEEQRLGRIDPRQDPLNISVLLLGPCFQYAFFRLFLGTSPSPTADQQYVVGVIQTLISGLEPKGSV
jgi:AcrR family transcriptional regulator